MKHTLSALAAAVMLAAAPAAFADSAPANMVAVVNIQQIMEASTAAKMVREQLESKQKSFQAEITKKEEQLQKEEQDLGKQQSVLSKSAFDEKVTAFRAKVNEAQKEGPAKKALLDNAFERALAQIQKATTEIIADMSKEKGFIIAVPTSQLLYADPKLDISDEVLKRLNQKLPKLDVKFDAPAPAASDKSDKK